MNVIQITDTHFYKTPEQGLYGLNADESLNAVINEAKKHHWPPDMLLVTGDLSQDTTPESYARLKRIFSGLQVPVYCLPGNHDHPEVMKAHLVGGNIRMERAFAVDGWQIVLLDSNIPGQHGGHLSEQELSFLEERLSASSFPTLIGFHHHALPAESAWLDTMVVNNAAAFLRVIDRHDHVKAVVTGHIHQERETRRRDVRFLATPSTCIQFKPASDKFGLDDVNPGYRWISLEKGGRINTEVRRVTGQKFVADPRQQGY